MHFVERLQMHILVTSLKASSKIDEFLFQFTAEGHISTTLLYLNYTRLEHSQIFNKETLWSNFCQLFTEILWTTVSSKSQCLPLHHYWTTWESGNLALYSWCKCFCTQCSQPEKNTQTNLKKNIIKWQCKYIKYS